MGITIAFLTIMIAGLLGAILICLNQILEELKKQNKMTEDAKTEIENAASRHTHRSEYGLGRPS